MKLEVVKVKPRFYAKHSHNGKYGIVDRDTRKWVMKAPNARWLNTEAWAKMTAGHWNTAGRISL